MASSDILCRPRTEVSIQKVDAAVALAHGVIGKYKPAVRAHRFVVLVLAATACGKTREFSGGQAGEEGANNGAGLGANGGSANGGSANGGSANGPGDESGGSANGPGDESGGSANGPGDESGGASPMSESGAGGELGGAAGSGGDDSECAATSRRCGGACLPYTQQCSCAGLGPICGAALDESCCERPSVPGGTFNRRNDATYPATVASFLLDRFEVTVGRFRAFVNAGFSMRDNPPAPGSGKNSNNAADVGWVSSWNQFLPVDKMDLESSLEKCPWSGWTAGGGDSLPITCVNWYVAQAFCIWDGGRLPTEAEWNFAAAGGGGADGQRYYPWSSPSIDQTLNNTYAVYETTAASAVGSRSPRGDAKWSHADMAGNASEMVIDSFADLPACTGAQHDCANFTETVTHEAVMRGGYFTNFTSYTTLARTSQDKQVGWFAQGFRCAYNKE
jgi:formylglycine-generating enzyme